MRVRPNGAELLRVARLVIEAAISSNIDCERRDVLYAIERAMTLAEDRLTRDVEASTTELAALEDARTAMRGEVIDALPEERRYDARLIAKAIAVAARQLANRHVPERSEYERLAVLLGVPTLPKATPSEIRCTLPALNERLGNRIRAGDADAGTGVHAAMLAHLQAITEEALSESNPTYRRRRSHSTPPGPSFMPPARPISPIDAAIAAWRVVPDAFMRAIPIDAGPEQLPQRVDAWVQLYGVMCGALYASANAALATQADLVGWFAQKLAANPHVPMAAVEGAHQAHDLSLAFADAGTTVAKLALAPFQRVELSAEATRVP